MLPEVVDGKELNDTLIEPKLSVMLLPILIKPDKKLKSIMLPTVRVF